MHIIGLVEGISNRLSEIDRIGSHNIPFRVTFFRLVFIVTRVINRHILFWQFLVNDISRRKDIPDRHIPWHRLDVIDRVIKSVPVVNSMDMCGLDLVGLVVSENDFEVVIAFGGNDDSLHFNVAGELDSCESDALISGI
jgi:hypothetical protein